MLAALALIASVLSTKELLAPSVEYQKRAFTQSLDIDYPPLPYDGSFSLTPDGYDGNDYKESFNGGDVDGSSWRQYVPLAVWPEIEWFDENGNYIGRSGGSDIRKTTVTKSLPVVSLQGRYARRRFIG
uniref:Uncharacterized protein n=1 Tax=Guillardia theta TaxID=55529 RepID=A0A7S4PPI4_GUITH|mmetsp:Transcript_7882/g.26367  ORF Transcript_7882/g.26367 Transcript_7882/m.26367 type:complete len:128 (+) Transcript_7882:186-569(+)